MWNLEKWYGWTYLQGSNGDADTENRLVATVRAGEEGQDDIVTLKHTHGHMWNK